MTAMLSLRDVEKSFTLHVQGGVTLPVFSNLNLEVGKGECVILSGQSGVGKSTLMRMIHANYVCPHGEILVQHDGKLIDMATAHPHVVLDVRRKTMGYVSQFLRVVPRVATLDIVAEPLRTLGVSESDAKDQAAGLLTRLNVPERLWSLSPITFSGGEQQRVNIARGFVHPYPVLLLDEPTASLDIENRNIVLSLICEARDAGAAIVGIFHDKQDRDAVVTRHFDMTEFKDEAA
ncbi:MAG: phosphonate C-P lyase system protein PhnL [Alphaproteobacteria bacterium]